jgi:membrane associated rhomboid family serine protease
VYSDFSSDEKKWVWRLVAANAFSFLLWQTWGNGATGRQAMWENFMVSIKSVRTGRLWVFFTSAWSSNDLITLMLNSTALLSFGTPILAALGTLPFLAFYFGASAVGACIHLESFAFPTQTQTPTANQLWYSDHASFHSSTAAASALAGYYAGAWGSRPLLVANTFNVPGFVLAGAFVLAQTFHADNTRQPWQGNLGGLAVGVALGFVFRRRIRI